MHAVSMLAVFVPSLKFHHSHESPTKLVMGLHARLRSACCYAPRIWPVLPVPVAHMPAVCDLPNKIRMLASDPLRDLLHMTCRSSSQGLHAAGHKRDTRQPQR